MNPEIFPILVVEDSPEDFETTARAFVRSGVVNDIHHCTDGDEALDYLYRRGKSSQKPIECRPAIILLDLNLPGTDGREVLKTIKLDEALKCIPVIILTTSDDERDIEHCYKLGANSYIQKPVNLAKFMAAIERLKDYWFDIVILPRNENRPEFS